MPAKLRVRGIDAAEYRSFSRHGRNRHGSSVGDGRHGKRDFCPDPDQREPGYGFAPDPWRMSLDLTVFNDQVLFKGRYTITNYGL